MGTLGEIESFAKEFAEARGRLVETVTTLQDKIDQLKRQYMPTIKLRVNTAMEKKANLAAAVEQSAGIFVKPRTIVIYGIKVGFTKGKGKIEWDDDAMVVKLIEKHFPEQAEVLIQTKKKPLKKALANLTVAELRKLGITVEDTGDIVVIKPVDSDVDKLVNALLKDDDREEEDAA